MKLDLQQIPELDRKGYRDFGLTTGAIVVGLFGLAIPWLLGGKYPSWPAPWPLSWPWLILWVLAALALLAPMALKPIYRVWMTFGLAIGTFVMTPLIMSIVFFLLFTPVGLVMRWLGKDGMKRKLDRDAASYRIKSNRPPVKNLEKPF